MLRCFSQDLSLPALITVSVMPLREAWNEFPFVLVFTMLSIVPILLFYLIFQKKVTSGLIRGAIK